MTVHVIDPASVSRRYVPLHLPLPVPRTLCGAPITGRDWTVADARKADDTQAYAWNVCTECRRLARAPREREPS